MHTDQPSKQDDFQRRPFADRVAKTIAKQTDPSPLVIAVNGAWGDGKSTVFGFLREALAIEKIPVLEFNAWQHSTDDAMLKSFFLGLAKTIDSPLLEKGEKLYEEARKKLEGLGELVKESSKFLPIPEAARGAGQTIVFTLGGKMGSWLTPNTQELQKRIRTKLNENAQRVAVLIDDPDRLDESELFTLLRLIKLTADFDYVTFVLAMDCDAVAKTVGRRFGGDEHGHRFLEKIVQVSLKLPVISRQRMLAYVVGLINQVITDLGLDIDGDDGKRFHEVFQPLLMPRIRTPRVAKQYANVLRFTLGILESGELNPVDVALLEGVRLFYPDAFQLLVDRGVAEGGVFSIEDLFDDGEKRRENAFAALIPTNWTESDKKCLRNALACLFPRQLANQSISEERRIELEKQRRVTCDEYLLRYLAAAIPEDDVADADIDSLAQAAETKTVADVAERLRPFMTSPASLLCMRKLRARQSNMSDRQMGTLGEAIALASDALSQGNSLYLYMSNQGFGQACYLAKDCVMRITDPAKRESAAADLLSKASSLIWARFLWRELPRELSKQSPDDRAKTPRFPEEVIKRLGFVVANRIQIEYQALKSLPSQYDLKSCLTFWASCGDQDALRSWTRKWLEADEGFLETIATLLVNWSDGEANQRRYSWPGDDAVRKLGSEMLDVTWVVSRFDRPAPPQRSFWGDDMTVEECTYQMLFVLKGGNRENDEDAEEADAESYADDSSGSET